MSKVYLQDSTLTSIANAIRAQTKSAVTLLPSEMPTAIAGIGGTTLRLRALSRKSKYNLRDWPGWNEASWEDIKYIIDEVALGLREELPEDIVVGVMKQWSIGDKHIIFKLEEINER